MKIGIIISLEPEILEKNFAKAKELEVESCQLSCWKPELLTKENAELLKALSLKYGIEISAVIGGWSGPKAWNFESGPMTLGIVPAAYRHIRTNELLKAIDFASELSVSDINTHIGFIPENSSDTLYKEVVACVKYICTYAKTKNINFCMETGQETPIALLRLIEDTQADNIGVNLDPANLLMYGKANPIDALDILGKYIKGVHGKDGEYPTSSKSLGNETPMGEGRVNFPLFIAKLKELGYDGSITIEREISGEKRETDIITARDILKSLI
ncbi:MAG: sugar phosphate isomerase/epimerase family protein [Clostridia bacterium]